MKSNNAEPDAEKIAWEWFATAHPHDAFAQSPERFWIYLQMIHPTLTREEMERILRETDQET